MACISGDCFVILPPHTEKNAIIFGRNSLEPVGAAQKVDYENDGELAVIDQFSDLGSESGANEKSVCVGIVWTANEPDEMKSSDIAKNVLQTSSTAEEAISNIGTLIETKGNADSKFSFIVCDPTSVWLVSTGGQLWAAEQIKDGYRRIPNNGLAVSTTIDKSIDSLGDKLKDLGLWDGSDNLDFAKSFSASPTTEDWSSDVPSHDGTFNLQNMLLILRSTSNDNVRSSQVSVLLNSGISCHWFTATPNPLESVYKPFVFAPNPKISPLTVKIDDGEEITMLQKLHSQRNWEKIGDLLKSLESTCIDEVNQYLNENPEPNQELDELMKDCVEAEVKFYR